MIESNHVPAAPSTIYQEWISWDIFLGKEFISFEQARSFARNLGLKTIDAWRKYCISGGKPDNIPATPNKVYIKEWNGYNDFLGLNYNYSRKQLSFEKAREFVRKLNLKNAEEWRNFCKSGKRPSDIHSAPYSKYKGKWKGWGDWLGTGNVSNRDKKYLPFLKAKKFVHSFHIKNLKEWSSYCQSGQKPKNIPSSPHVVYEEYIDSYDWLGTSWERFEIARIFARKLNLKTTRDWKKYCSSGKKPENIPNSPSTVYAPKWISWHDWLNND